MDVDIDPLLPAAQRASMIQFQHDLTEGLDAIATVRASLLSSVARLTSDDLNRARRGGWAVRAALRHVIDSEAAYAKVIGFLRSRPVEVAGASDDDVATAVAATRALQRTRATLVALLDGIDEATFYDLQALGKEQYSVASVLENVASHDHEHLEQIKKTLVESRS
jgi:uncharacterized damage-inducible protein DinB